MLSRVDEIGSGWMKAKRFYRPPMACLLFFFMLICRQCFLSFTSLVHVLSDFKTSYIDHFTHSSRPNPTRNQVSKGSFRRLLKGSLLWASFTVTWGVMRIKDYTNPCNSGLAGINAGWLGFRLVFCFPPSSINQIHMSFI